MSEIVKNRSEILFYYDIKDANPNGDPLDENKPRIDEETGKNMVSDVRIKRTVRDYFIKFKGYNNDNEKTVLIQEMRDNKGDVRDMKTRAKDFGKDRDEIRKNILKTCIDVRLFGGTIALKEEGEEKKGDSITLTGPVQFNMLNQSKHRVSMIQVGHTFSMSSGKGKGQGSQATEYVVPYSFIEVSGIINENAATETKLTEEDVTLLLEGLWEGTKNLITRSKFGQMPRLLLKVTYKEDNFHLGGLGSWVEIVSEKNNEELRSISDFKLDVTHLVNALNKNKNKIEEIGFKLDPGLVLIKDNKPFDLSTIGKEI